MPLGVAPSAMQRMAHPDGECGNARGKFKYYNPFDAKIRTLGMCHAKIP